MSNAECKSLADSEGKSMVSGFYGSWAKGCIKPQGDHAFDYFYQNGDYDKDCSSTNPCICGAEGFENMNNEGGNQFGGCLFIIIMILLVLIFFNCKVMK